MLYLYISNNFQFCDIFVTTFYAIVDANTGL